MDLEKGEDSVLEEEWGLDFEEALLLGLILIGEEGDCQGAGISLVEQPVHLWQGRISRLLTLLIRDLVLGRPLIHSTLEHPWLPCQECRPLLELLPRK